MVEHTCIWYDEAQTIILIEIGEGVWDWQDAYDAMQRVQEMAESIPHDVYVIQHFKQSPPMPESDIISHMRRLMSMRPANEALTIFIGVNPIFTTLLQTVARIQGLHRLLGKFRFAVTLEQALVYVRAHKRKNRPNGNAAESR